MTISTTANARVWNAVVFPGAMTYPSNRALQPRSLARAFTQKRRALIKDRTFATTVNLIQVKSLTPNHHEVERRRAEVGPPQGPDVGTSDPGADLGSC
jgi:hypothetical protein